MKRPANRPHRRSPAGFAMLAGLVIATLASSSALAQGTPEQRAACEGDAMRLCGQHVPNVELITSCMASKRRLLSAACRRVFDGGAKRRARGS